MLSSLVQNGQAMHINWSSSYMSTCTLKGSNADTWTALQSAVGGETSSPITTQTVYTLKCLDLNGLTKTKSVTVTLLPTFQEI